MTKVAIVKLDPIETKSTGGIVEKVFLHMVREDGVADEPGDYRFPWRQYEGNSAYKVITNASDDVNVGWIYQDKTHILRDPNL